MGRSLVLAAVFSAIAVAGFVYQLNDGASEARACGQYGPYDFDTLEMPDYREDYTTAIRLLAEGKVFSGLTEAGGTTVDFRYQGLEKGTRADRVGTAVPADPSYRIPPTIYYSIAWIEANWAQAATTVPWGGVGPVLRSFDCGYGLGQITSGMGNSTGTPSVKQALIGTHFMFNMAEGMRILADKWNQAPEYRPIAGEGDPEALEDWYYAIWSYNGFAFTNHPMNPDRDPLRAGDADSPIYHCYDENAPSYVEEAGTDDPAFGYGDYTYPERAYGCMRHPPTYRGQQMWESVDFRMPDFEREEVAKAFEVENFTECSGGCPGMDFPTSFPEDEIETSEDPTEPIDLAEAEQFLGSPALSFSGPTSASLEVAADGTIDSVTVTATNNGTFIAPFRVISSERWLVARNAGDSSSRTLDGGVAVGSETEVVISGSETKDGHSPSIQVTLDPQRLPAGPVTATITFQSLIGGGSHTVQVSAVNNYTPPTPTPTPSPTPTQLPEPAHQNVLPGLAANP